MGNVTVDLTAWAEEQFGKCDLGDKRRTERLCRVAAAVAADPSGSFPQQMDGWGDLKAAYRLFDSDGVTFAAVARRHWEQTRAREKGRYLILSDTTEIDFGIGREIPKLGPTGNGGGYGFLLHSGLMVAAESEEIIGLTAQVLHYRKPAPHGENTTQRLQRKRESEIWGEVIDQTGRPREGVEFMHVMDRGADNFEVFCHARERRVGWVVRATQMGRRVLAPSGEKIALGGYVKALPLAGTYELHLRARPKQPARTAKLEVRFGALAMPEPTQKSPYVKRLKPGAIPIWVVWVREADAPHGVEPIEWVLYTSLPVESFDDAWCVIAYYEKRWLIEEWHKALKTGCRVAHRQLKEKERLEPMTALMSVEAVRLLQLKSMARLEPARRAEEVVPLLWIQMLIVVRRLPRDKRMTVGEFYRGVAKLGGFIGRKSDGEPGWMTIWRGWEQLNTLVRGAELADQLNKTRRNCG
jgi:hypothetical protein